MEDGGAGVRFVAVDGEAKGLGEDEEGVGFFFLRRRGGRGEYDIADPFPEYLSRLDRGCVLGIGHSSPVLEPRAHDGVNKGRRSATSGFVRRDEGVDVVPDAVIGRQCAID